MTYPKALLDTDILSFLRKKHPVVLGHAQTYLMMHHYYTFSIITRYEILCGLTAKGATSQLKTFDLFCLNSFILPITDTIVGRAAKIYATLKQSGALIGDADILIAASALEYELVLVTNNERHFNRIPDIQIHNWTKA